jgi:hypothetical protein
MKLRRSARKPVRKAARTRVEPASGDAIIARPNAEADSALAALTIQTFRIRIALARFSLMGFATAGFLPFSISSSGGFWHGYLVLTFAVKWTVTQWQSWRASLCVLHDSAFSEWLRVSGKSLSLVFIFEENSLID